MDQEKNIRIVFGGVYNSLISQLTTLSSHIQLHNSEVKNILDKGIKSDKAKKDILDPSMGVDKYIEHIKTELLYLDKCDIKTINDYIMQHFDQIIDLCNRFYTSSYGAKQVMWMEGIIDYCPSLYGLVNAIIHILSSKMDYMIKYNDYTTKDLT